MLLPDQYDGQYNCRLTASCMWRVCFCQHEHILIVGRWLYEYVIIDLNLMMGKLREGNTVIVWKLDRIARSISHLLKLVDGLNIFDN